jgi:hypothetical protein
VAERESPAVISSAFQTLPREPIVFGAQFWGFNQRGTLEADAEFGPHYSRSALESEIRTWIRSEAAKPDGIGKVRELMATNRDVANVIWHSPNFLVGIQEDLHQEYRYRVMKTFSPDTYAKVAESVELRNVGPKLDTAIANVKRSFYSPALAAEAATRVEV